MCKFSYHPPKVIVGELKIKLYTTPVNPVTAITNNEAQTPSINISKADLFCT
jgi:hypothetical protein